MLTGHNYTSQAQSFSTYFTTPVADKHQCQCSKFPLIFSCICVVRASTADATKALESSRHLLLHIWDILLLFHQIWYTGTHLQNPATSNKSFTSNLVTFRQFTQSSWDAFHRSTITIAFFQVISFQSSKISDTRHIQPSTISFSQFFF